jgi:hypothetical protein
MFMPILGVFLRAGAIFMLLWAVKFPHATWEILGICLGVGLLWDMANETIQERYKRL